MLEEQEALAKELQAQDELTCGMETQDALAEASEQAGTEAAALEAELAALEHSNAQIELQILELKQQAAENEARELLMKGRRKRGGGARNEEEKWPHWVTLSFFSAPRPPIPSAKTAEAMEGHNEELQDNCEKFKSMLTFLEQLTGVAIRVCSPWRGGLPRARSADIAPLYFLRYALACAPGADQGLH